MAPDLELWEGLLRLVVAALLAGVIGVERELREQRSHDEAQQALPELEVRRHHGRPRRPGQP